MLKPIDSLLLKLKLKHDYQEVFKTPAGQRVLADILKRAGVTAPIFESSPERARFLEGHRHFAHSIYRMVHSSDAPLLKLIAEENNKTTYESNH